MVAWEPGSWAFVTLLTQSLSQAVSLAEAMLPVPFQLVAAQSTANQSGPVEVKIPNKRRLSHWELIGY